MGFFKKILEGRQQKAAQATYDSAMASWKAESQHVDDLLYAATRLEELYEAGAEAGLTIRLKPAEHAILVLQPSGLVEPRSTGGSYQGGSQGVSFRVAKGVRYRVGQHRGTFVPGPEVQKVIDSGGSTYITTQRVIYGSPNRNREWAYSKLVDTYHSDTVGNGLGATYLGVSNRQKTSGFVYSMEHARTIRDRLLLALAIFDGTIEDLITGLKEQATELELSRPNPPALPS